MTKKTYLQYVLILGSLTAVGPFSIDMYLPGFEDISKSLHCSVSSVAISLSSYFIGISVGQLLYGPLLDRFGRKKPLYAGLVLYLIATAVCMQAHDINTLIILRFVQAVGGCAAQVTAMAMVRDIFGPTESAKVFSLLLLVLGVSPMIAPTAGSYIVVAFGWRAIFLALLLLGVFITLLTVFFLPESHKPDPTFSLKPGPIVTNFISVARQPQFIVFALVQSLAFAGLFAYVTGSPIVFMDIFHVSKQVYGWIFAFLSVAFIGLSQFNSLFLKKYSSERIIWIALTGEVVVSLLFLGGNMAGWYGLPQTILFIFLFLTCLGFTNPNAAALALAPFSRNAGTASALLGALQMGIGALASFGIGAFSNGTANPMIGIMAITSALALIILVIGKRSGKMSVEASTGDSAAPIH